MAGKPPDPAALWASFRRATAQAEAAETAAAAAAGPAATGAVARPAAAAAQTTGPAAAAPRVRPAAATPLPRADSTRGAVACTATPIARGYPLGFADLAQFETCMQEMCDAAQADGLRCTTAGVRGSAATDFSRNPRKVGKRFTVDGRGKSDIDAFVVSDTRLEATPSNNFFHPDKVEAECPQLASWSEKWTGILGREITPAIFRPGATQIANDAADPDFIKYATRGPTRR